MTKQEFKKQYRQARIDHDMGYFDVNLVVANQVLALRHTPKVCNIIYTALVSKSICPDIVGRDIILFGRRTSIFNY